MKILVITIIPVLLSSTIYNISGIIDQGLFKNIAGEKCQNIFDNAVRYFKGE